jgi:serine/threonine-protein kinase PknG
MTATCREVLDGAACGGEIDADGYCTRCGAAADEPPAPQPPTRPQPAPSPSTGRAGHTSSRRGSGGSSRRSSSIGGGRGQHPADDEGDPLEHLMPDPALPEKRRRCRNPQCRKPVGQASTVGGPGPVTGFCRVCGWGFSFRPPLQPDAETGYRVTVAGRYEVFGAIGRGGLGWVYLAFDTLLSRHVVLKGLLDPDDPAKRSVARDELEKLVGANHEHVVTVYDFVQHAHRLPPKAGGAPGGVMPVDYIVMKYIDGESLYAKLQRRHAEHGAHLTIVEAANALIPVLRALAYLHDRGLVYNDLKPENVMIAESGRPWLVDLGAVSVAGGDPGYGTDGYRDPYGNAPSEQTDIYTAGRTLAALTFRVPGFAKGAPLPGPDDEPLLAEHPSFHGLLQRATDPHPDRRFASVDELVDQLTAVVREARARTEGRQPGLSNVFAPEVRVVGALGFPALPADGAAWAMTLPDGLIDPDDPHAKRLAALKAAGPRELLTALDALPDPTTETRLQALRARVELLGADAETAYAALVHDLAALAAAEPDDVRVPWLAGIAALVQDKIDTAAGQFAEVLRRVPGEAAPKLACAIVAERGGDPATAEGHYATVWRTDGAYLSAAFGLARTRLAQGKLVAAIEALGEVPHSSRYATDAALGALTAAATPVADGNADLAPGYFAKAARLDVGHAERLDVDDLRRQEAVIAALHTAAAWLARRKPWPGDAGAPPTQLLGVALTKEHVRDGLEAAYLRMARHPAVDPATRIAYVDRANRERNWSLW